MNPTWIEFAARGAGLLLLALLLYWAAKRASAGVRHALLTTGMLGLLVLPALTHVLPVWEAPVLPAAEPDLAPPAAAVESLAPTAVVEAPPPQAEARATDDGAERLATAAIPAQPRVEPAVAPPAPRAVATSSLPWATYGWGLGALLVLLPWIVGLVRVTRWTRQAVALERSDVAMPDGARVCVHPAVTTPMTAGIVRPTLLLPVAARSWPRERLVTVLAHEQAHVDRRDVLKNACARIAAALHWFNPLVWLAAARLRRESELACDAAVLRVGVRPTALASILVEIARESRAVRLHGAACTLGPSGLERRVEAILSGQPREPTRKRRGLRVAAALAVCAAVVLVATLQPTARVLFAEEEDAGAKDTPVVTVAQAGADYDSIQAAVDAAPPGARIRVGPGTWAEQVTISKPLVLEGAGFEATQIETVFDPTTMTGPQLPATVTVRDTKDVDLVGLRLSLRRKGVQSEGRIYGGAVLAIENARVRVMKCAVVGSPASGVTITGQSYVEMVECLVAAIRATGIAIRANEAGTPSARIDGCDVRYGHHRGITIGPGCDDVLVQRCRIMGSGWHGIRYDNASPHVLHNRIGPNVRFAIYASGRTRAQVQGNFFADSGMSAVGCWHHCEDVITRNSFVSNEREGISILGAAAPTVTQNVFVAEQVGVRWSGIAGRGGGVESAGKGTVTGNWFWGCVADTSIPLPAENGNRSADPKLLGDGALAPDSPARAAGVGAADLPPTTSPYPEQPEEKDAARLFKSHWERYSHRKQATVQEPGTEKAPGTSTPSPATAPARTPHEIAKPWIAAIVRPTKGNREGRAEAWSAVREALAHDDPTRNHAALLAVLGTTQIRYDRASLRPLVLPLVRKLEGHGRVKAFYALFQTGMETGDLALVLAAVDQADPALRDSASHLIHLFSKGQVVGEAEAAVLKLLESKKTRELREVFRGLWGAHVGPALEQRLLEFSRNPALVHDVVYFALSTLANKSADVVRALARVASAQQGEMGRVIWGLGHGIRDEAAGEAVADFYAERIVDLARADWVDKGLRALEQYGTARHLDVVKSFAEDEDIDPNLRARAQRVVQVLSRR